MTSCEHIVLTTESISPAEKPEWWASVIRETLGLDSKVEAIGEQAFQQSLRASSLGEIVIGARKGSPFRASWENSESAFVLADINIEGHCTRRHNGHPQVLLEPRSICIFPMAERGSICYTDDTTHIFLAFPASLLEEYCPEWQDKRGTPIPADAGAAALLLEWADALQRNAESLSSDCRCDSGRTLIGLLGAALCTAEDENSQSSRLRAYHQRRIRQYILTHLANPELNVSKIAGAVGLSPRYLHSLFADEPLRLMQWVQEQRLQRCKMALLSGRGNATIAQIAYSFGFNDAAHFSRSFQRRFDLPPREFRKLSRSPKND